MDEGVGAGDEEGDGGGGEREDEDDEAGGMKRGRRGKVKEMAGKTKE